ncbi:MAG: hypothetical protein ACI9W6_000472 [Motiliproteus sp.]|jgi:hypothetical protein
MKKEQGNDKNRLLHDCDYLLKNAEKLKKQYPAVDVKWVDEIRTIQEQLAASDETFDGNEKIKNKDLMMNALTGITADEERKLDQAMRQSFFRSHKKIIHLDPEAYEKLLKIQEDKSHKSISQAISYLLKKHEKKAKSHANKND